MKSLSCDEVYKLSDDELRHELEDRSVSVGPVTDFTRGPLQRILLSKLGLTHSNDGECHARSDGWASQAIEAKPSEDQADMPPPIYTFFGVFLPADACAAAEDKTDLLPVYTDKAKCLAALKLYKGSRFKTFSSYDDAFYFSKNGIEMNASLRDFKDPVQTNSGACSKTTSDSISLEKPCAFRGPSSQDRVLFRKTIEKGNVSGFLEFVRNNPRYLVSTSDCPTILKEGSRYNAMHVACLHGQHVMCALILEKVSQHQLFRLLYPDDAEETCIWRQKYLLDLYLNMPDKGLNETPLHIACKNGNVQCVKLLTAHDGCNMNPINKYGSTPKEITCQRYSGNDSEQVKHLILELLEPQYFVPVLRDDSFSMPPIVGKVWSPRVSNTEEHVEFAGSCSRATFSQFNVSSLLNDSVGSNLNSSNCEPNQFVDTSQQRSSSHCQLAMEGLYNSNRKIEAFLGPLPIAKAQIVRKRWREIARLGSLKQSPLSTPVKIPTPLYSTSTPKQHPLSSITDTFDYEKGLEIVGRKLAVEYETNWYEYWDFLDEFLDISTTDGQQKLEKHLRINYNMLLEEEQNFDTCDESCVVEKDVAEDEGIYATDPSHAAVSPSTVHSECELPDSAKRPGDRFVSKDDSDSSLGSLCRGLEAIRLNASLSPVASHHSPLAQRHYDELMQLLRSNQQQRVHELTESQSREPTGIEHDQLDYSLRHADELTLHYVCQSCRVTARQVSLVLQDMAADHCEARLSQLALMRAVKAKVSPELHALQVIVWRACVDVRSVNNNNSGSLCAREFLSNGSSCVSAKKINDSENMLNNKNVLEKVLCERGTGFLHAIIAVESIQMMQENWIPAEFVALQEILEAICSESNLLDYTFLSDDEETDNSLGATRNYQMMQHHLTNKRHILAHVKCVLLLLNRLISKTLAIHQLEQISNECKCNWANCGSVLAKFAQYINFDVLATMKEHQNDIPTGKSNFALMSGSQTDVNSVSVNSSRGSKFSKAHSYLRDTLFAVSDVETCSTPCIGATGKSGIKTEEMNLLVKHLQFDDEGSGNVLSEEALLSNSLLIRPSDRISDVHIKGVNNDSGHPEEGAAEGDDTDDSYETAATSSNSSMVTPDEAKEVFINGCTPSKKDLDVLQALNGRDIDELRFPLVAQWQQMMRSKLAQLETEPRTPLKEECPSFCPVFRRKEFNSPLCSRSLLSLLAKPLMTSSPRPRNS